MLQAPQGSTRPAGAGIGPASPLPFVSPGLLFPRSDHAKTCRVLISRPRVNSLLSNALLLLTVKNAR